MHSIITQTSHGALACLAHVQCRYAPRCKAALPGPWHGFTNCFLHDCDGCITCVLANRCAQPPASFVSNRCGGHQNTDFPISNFEPLESSLGLQCWHSKNRHFRWPVVVIDSALQAYIIGRLILLCCLPHRVWERIRHIRRGGCRACDWNPTIKAMTWEVSVVTRGAHIEIVKDARVRSTDYFVLIRIRVPS